MAGQSQSPQITQVVINTNAGSISTTQTGMPPNQMTILGMNLSSASVVTLCDSSKDSYRIVSTTLDGKTPSGLIVGFFCSADGLGPLGGAICPKVLFSGHEHHDPVGSTKQAGGKSEVTGDVCITVTVTNPTPNGSTAVLSGQRPISTTVAFTVL